MEKRYKEIDGVRYQVIQNTILGSNVVPVGESLPEVTTSDSGKLLGVDSSGEWVPVEAPSGLPDITGNAGKILKVNAGATGTEWANETSELPSLSGNAGKVLKVDADAEGVEWGEAGGDVLIATFSQDSITEEWSCDKSGAEINEALQKGIVYAKIDGYSNLIPMIYAYYDNSIDEDYQFIFELDTSNTNYNIFITPGLRCIIEMSPSLITVSFVDSDMAFLSWYYLNGTPTFPQTGDSTIPTSIDLSGYDDEYIIFIPGVTHITYSAYLLDRDCTVLSAQRDSNGGIIIALAIISEFGAYVHRYEYNPTLKTLEYMDAGE